MLSQTETSTNLMKSRLSYEALSHSRGVCAMNVTLELFAIVVLIRGVSADAMLERRNTPREKTEMPAFIICHPFHQE